jgi:hypothetical protein
VKVGAADEKAGGAGGFGGKRRFAPRCGCCNPGGHLEATLEFGYRIRRSASANKEGR